MRYIQLLSFVFHEPYLVTLSNLLRPQLPTTIGKISEIFFLLNFQQQLYLSDYIKCGTRKNVMEEKYGYKISPLTAQRREIF